MENMKPFECSYVMLIWVNQLAYLIILDYIIWPLCFPFQKNLMHTVITADKWILRGKSEVENFKKLLFSPHFLKQHIMFGLDQCAAEIAMFENNIVIYKFAQDLHFFVTRGDYENELIISTVLQGFFDAVSLLLR